MLARLVGVIDDFFFGALKKDEGFRIWRVKAITDELLLLELTERPHRMVSERNTLMT